MQDWSNSIANALELLQSCTKPSNYFMLTTDTYISLGYHTLQLMCEGKIWYRTCQKFKNPDLNLQPAYNTSCLVTTTRDI